ncbi:MAG: Rne/Rng family ribonuclease, partial [Pseudomonadota bacterium]
MPSNSTNKMLIDASHPEETRVVVLRHGRVEEFDYESAARKLLRGNIYLAKVTRVEPALQAAFVDYGGNRHGFLAFNEIHPDYYQIPIADRQALLDEEAAIEAEEEAEADARAERMARGRNGRSGRRGGRGRGRGASADNGTDSEADSGTDLVADADLDGSVDTPAEADTDVGADAHDGGGVEIDTTPNADASAESISEHDDTAAGSVDTVDTGPEPVSAAGDEAASATAADDQAEAQLAAEEPAMVSASHQSTSAGNTSENNTSEGNASDDREADETDLSDDNSGSDDDSSGGPPRTIAQAMAKDPTLQEELGASDDAPEPAHDAGPDHAAENTDSAIADAAAVDNQTLDAQATDRIVSDDESNADPVSASSVDGTSDDGASDDSTGGTEALPQTAKATNDVTADETNTPSDDTTDVEDRATPDADTDDESDAADGEGESDGSDDDAPEDVDTDEDAYEEVAARPRRSRRTYKIQEVIKRRQVILIQVVKEERGNKGAALTTYLSLAGRYTVLMPNTARGGGISRKITNPQDRKRLKAIANELEVPEGMGLIIRTAGAARTKQEIRRDFEYLLRLWESVRELTLESTAPSLVYEEGNLIKRSIRDLYNKEVEEVLVAGEPSYREAKDFMRMLMPSHAKNVTAYKDPEPLFARFQIERQLNAMFSPQVTLPSGGYLVINQTEALVAVDVNSGRSTREFSIEETALNTNLEAADELARQLKLRDLAGLIVIDFIDMDEKRNNRSVERRLKEALRHDRARIQVGRISHFGLLEMSRQRMRTGVLEGSTTQCAACQGTGIIRSTESIALAVLRGLEDAVTGRQRGPLTATTTHDVALYILNNKREFIQEMEARCGFAITIEGSSKMVGANFAVERGPAAAAPRRRNTERAVVNIDWGFEEHEETAAGASLNGSAGDAAETRGPDTRDLGARDSDDSDGDDQGQRKRRRRRRRGGRRNVADDASGIDAASDETHDDSTQEREHALIDADDDGSSEHANNARSDSNSSDEDGDGQTQRRGRRRGRRGGRR